MPVGPYLINAGVTTIGGTITPTGGVNVPDGATQVFTITPAIGYRVLCITVDGVALGPALSYTFVNVTANHDIAVSFRCLDFINLIADAIVARLKTINGPAGGYTNNFTTGATIERAPTLLDWASLPRPYLGVRFDNVSEAVPGTYGQYRVTGDFNVGFLVDVGALGVDRAAPERRAATVVADIMEAIATDVNLDGVLELGVAHPGPVTISQDPNLGALLAYGSITISAAWLWQA